MAQTADRIEIIILAAKSVEKVVLVGEDSMCFVVVETEDFPGPHVDGENGPAHNRGHNAFEAAAVNRQLCFKDGIFVIQHCAPPGSDGSERTRGLCRSHLAYPRKSLPH